LDFIQTNSSKPLEGGLVGGAAKLSKGREGSDFSSYFEAELDQETVAKSPSKPKTAPDASHLSSLSQPSEEPLASDASPRSDEELPPTSKEDQVEPSPQKEDQQDSESHRDFAPTPLPQDSPENLEEPTLEKPVLDHGQKSRNSEPPNPQVSISKIETVSASVIPDLQSQSSETAEFSQLVDEVQLEVSVTTDAVVSLEIPEISLELDPRSAEPELETLEAPVLQPSTALDLSKAQEDSQVEALALAHNPNKVQELKVSIKTDEEPAQKIESEPQDDLPLSESLEDWEFLLEDPQLRQAFLEVLGLLEQGIRDGSLNLGSSGSQENGGDVLETLQVLKLWARDQKATLGLGLNKAGVKKALQAIGLVLSSQPKAGSGQISIPPGLERVFEELNKPSKGVRIETHGIEIGEVEVKKTQTPPLVTLTSQKTTGTPAPILDFQPVAKEEAISSLAEVDSPQPVLEKVKTLALASTSVKPVSVGETQATATVATPASGLENQSSGADSQDSSKEGLKREEVLEVLKSKTKPKGSQGSDFMSVVDKTQTEDSTTPHLSKKISMGEIAGNSVQKLTKANFGPTQSRMILTQVVDQIKKVNPPRITSIRMTIKPEALGELRFEVRQEKDGLRVLFEADSRGVKEVLDRNISSLREAFKAQGLDLNKIDVEVRDEGSGDRQAQRREEQEGRRRRSRNQKDFSLEDEDEQTQDNELEEHQINQYA
jgi:flagellar hook-length control protein FliK